MTGSAPLKYPVKPYPNSPALHSDPAPSPLWAMALETDLFNGVDLSQLPPPAVIEVLSFDAVRDAMLADILALLPDFNALSPSDPVVKLVEYFAYRELLWRQRVNDASLGNMLATATGADLDNLGALYGLRRLTLVAADPANGIAEVKESDTEFRDRIVRAPETFSVAGPVGAYVNNAKNADPQVRHASCHSPTPGEVVVTVQARDGDGSADAALIATVSAWLNDEDRRPLTDQVTVQSADIKPFAILADIRTFSGPDAAMVLATARAKLDAWLIANQRLGRDITEDGIHAQLRVEGVSRVALQGWADIVCDDTEAAYCTAVTLNHVGIGE